MLALKEAIQLLIQRSPGKATKRMKNDFQALEGLNDL